MTIKVTDPYLSSLIPWEARIGKERSLLVLYTASVLLQTLRMKILSSSQVMCAMCASINAALLSRYSVKYLRLDLFVGAYSSGLCDGYRSC